MSIAPQPDADPQNSQPESSLKFALFSTKNCVRPEQTNTTRQLWNKFHPEVAIEDMITPNSMLNDKYPAFSQCRLRRNTTGAAP